MGQRVTRQELTQQSKLELERLRLMTTSEAAKFLDVSNTEIWRFYAKGLLSAPRRPTARRCYWLVFEIEKLAGHPRPAIDREHIMPIEHAAKLIGVCKETVRRMVEDGRLSPPVKKGNRMFWRTSAVERAAAKRDYNKLVDVGYIRRAAGLSDSKLIGFWNRGKLPKIRAEGRDGVQLYYKGEVDKWCENYKKGIVPG